MPDESSESLQQETEKTEIFSRDSMRNQFNKTDRKILSMALLMLLLALYLMYDDTLLFPDQSDNSLKTIGKIENTQFDVRRKISQQFSWKPTRGDEPIHQGDALFTGEKSQATIRLNDGRVLTVAENSMIVFDNTNNQVNLDLHFGKLAGTISGCLKVNAGGKAVDVCGQNKKIEIDSDGAVHSERKPASAGDIVWVHGPPTLLLHQDRNTPLSLSWKATTFFARYRLQIASDDEFKKIVFQEISGKKSLITHGYPSQGSFFVRIRGEDLKGRASGFSETSKIDFRQVSAPQIITPQAHEIREFKTNADGDVVENNRVKISWSFALPTSGFDVQVASNPDFKNPEMSFTTPVLSALTPALRPGKYYVRVRASDLLNDTPQPWAEVVPFQVTFTDAYKLKAPELLTKLIQHAVPSEKEPTVVWKPVEQAQKYILQFSHGADFISPATLQTKDTHITLTNYPAGTSYFRVFASTEKGTLGPASDIGQLHVISKKPVLNPVEPKIILGKSQDDHGEPQKFKLSWSDNKLAKSYVVQVSKDPGFRDRKQFVTRAPASEVVVPHPGETYWRVQPLDQQGQPLSTFSDNGNMNYILKVPLTNPTLIEPINAITLYYQRQEAAYIWLEWTPVNDANAYTLEVALDREFRQVVLTAQSPTSHYLVKQSLPPGKLYWRVRALGDFQRMSWWSDAREMNVYSGRMPAGE
jgi:hypothetical protein